MQSATAALLTGACSRQGSVCCLAQARFAQTECSMKKTKEATPRGSPPQYAWPLVFLSPPISKCLHRCEHTAQSCYMHVTKVHLVAEGAHTVRAFLTGLATPDLMSEEP